MNTISTDVVRTQSLLFGTTFEGTKVKFTEEGGLAIKMTNRTSKQSIKGYLVRVSRAVDLAVELVAVNSPDTIGVFYEDGVADGDEVWVVVSGLADVYFFNAPTRGHLARSLITADGGYDGVVRSEAFPSPPFATDKHFCEIGHVLESKASAGLARCLLHFN